MRTPPPLPLLGWWWAGGSQYRRLFSHYRSSGGVVRAQVTYNGEQVTFTPEEVTAMVLVQLKAISENYLRTKVKDVVISIPGFFTSAQRRGTSSATNLPARARDARHPITFTAAAAAGRRLSLSPLDVPKGRGKRPCPPARAWCVRGGRERGHTHPSSSVAAVMRSMESIRAWVASSCSSEGA